MGRGWSLVKDYSCLGRVSSGVLLPSRLTIVYISK